MPTLKQTYEYEHEPVRVAQRIVEEFVDMRNSIKSSAEGFAILDFIQGHVATELPTAIARDIVVLLRGMSANDSREALDDLILLWLENYRRAFSHIIMRILEDGADSITA